MQYILGLILLAIVLTYPIGRWQARRQRAHPERVAALEGDASGAQHDTSPIAAEGLMRGGGFGQGMGGGGGGSG